MEHVIHHKPAREAEILHEIRDSEKKADELIERAGKESESIVHEARANSAKLCSEKEVEIMQSYERKISDFQENAKLIFDEKVAEGKIAVKQLKAKSQKNIGKAAEFIMKSFEEMI